MTWIQWKEKETKIKLEQEKMRTSLRGRLLPGEEEVRKGTEMKVYSIKRQDLELGSVAEMHFRYAESQFMRLKASNCQVTEVEYFVNPKLVRAFEGELHRASAALHTSCPFFLFFFS